MSRSSFGPVRVRLSHSPSAGSPNAPPRPHRRRLPAWSLLLALPAAAQTLAPAGAAAAPDTVVVTGTRTPVRLDRVLAETTVIERAQIEQAAGRTLAELLARQPGVQAWSNGGPGTSASVSLRGLESRHTLLLVDGVRHGSATVGTPVWENLPLDGIDRIEVVRGPLSGLYGSQAMGGVVQVFTRTGAPGLRTDASLSAGSRGSVAASAGARFGSGAVDGAVQVGAQRTRGISATNARVPFGSFDPDDDGFRQTSGSARLGWGFAAGWRAEASVLAADGVGRLDDGAGADARAALRTRVAAVRVGGAVQPGWTTLLRASRSADGYETLATASPFVDLGTIGTVQRQFGWENRFATPLGTALLLAEHLRETVSRPGAAFEVSERTTDGVALGLDGRAGVRSWQASLRHDRNSQFGSPTTGSLGYGHDFGSAWRAAVSVGTGFVAPSFNQLYYPGFGNPALQPERGRHGELSLRWAGAGQQWRVAYFDNRIRGYIDSGAQPTNIPRIRSDGVSASYTAAGSGWTLGASVDHANPRNATAGSADEGRLLPRRARDSLRLVADTALGAWRVGAGLTAVGHSFDDAANTVRVGGRGVVDLHAHWTPAPQWTLALALNNAGAKRYETVYGYNQPGRQVFVTLRHGAR